MGTGGGELLLKLKEGWPKKVAVTEAYLSNFQLATKRLVPLGAKVFNVQLTEADFMPFKDDEFELVLNSHSRFNPSEVAKILTPGGVFLTQQVHALHLHDLTEYFKATPQYIEATPENYIPKLKAARLTIAKFKECSGKISFTDVGAIVYFLKAIPWVVSGFSVETHLEYLLSLQHRLEDDESLAFTSRFYLIEAHKKF